MILYSLAPGTTGLTFVLVFAVLSVKKLNEPTQVLSKEAVRIAEGDLTYTYSGTVPEDKMIKYSMFLNE